MRTPKLEVIENLKRNAGDLAAKVKTIAHCNTGRAPGWLGATMKDARAEGEAHGKLLGHDKRGHTKDA